MTDPSLKPDVNAAPAETANARLPWSRPRLTLLSGQSTAGGASAARIERVIPALTYRPTSF